MLLNRLGPALAFTLLTLITLPSRASDSADAGKLVDDARITLSHFMADPDMTWARDHLRKAHGVLLIPTYTKAGFIIGGAGGKGVLLTRDRDGSWNGPAFYYLGAASIGFQAGVDVAEIMLMVMTEKGVDALLGGDIKLGGDVGVAIGPKGAAANAATADIIGFSRSQGLFAGVAFDGSVVNPDADLNRAYYGSATSPVDILVRRTAANAAAGDLRAAVTRAATP